MTFKYISLFGLLSLLVPVLVFAAPDSVSNISASYQNNAITVTWSPVANAESYVVYYSHQSILNSGGDYDDSVRVMGGSTRYTFPRPPFESGVLYVSVLALDSQGQESDGFETEASVTVVPVVANAVPTLPSVPSSSSSSVSMPSLMTISALRPVSSTGVLITFTKEISPSYRTVVSNFPIADASGATLPLTRIERGTNTLLLHTAPQKPQTAYVLSFLENIPSSDGSVFPAYSAPAKFLGFSDDVLRVMQALSEAASSSSSLSSSLADSSSLSSSSSSTPDHQEQPSPSLQATLVPSVLPELSLSLQNEKNGYFDVLVTWTNDAPVDGYRLLTSLNGSRFTEQMRLRPSDRQALLTHVRSGTDLSVQLLSITGQTVSPPVTRSLTLPESGFGTSLITALALGYAAYAWFQRRTFAHSSISLEQ